MPPPLAPPLPPPRHLRPHGRGLSPPLLDPLNLIQSSAIPPPPTPTPTSRRATPPSSSSCSALRCALPTSPSARLASPRLALALHANPLRRGSSSPTSTPPTPSSASALRGAPGHREPLAVFEMIEAAAARHGVRANDVTVVSVLGACAHLGDVVWRRRMHQYLKERGFPLNFRLATSLSACMQSVGRSVRCSRYSGLCLWRALIF
ncbi:hypothetical protein ABZP36_011922 [Zizania latifolia]